MPTVRGTDPAVEEHFLGALYRGGELLASGKIIEAREHLEKAHELEPKNEKAQNLLGLTYFKLGLFDLAAQVYGQLVQENPADPTLRVNLGLVHLKTSDLERSIREFETATDLEPGHKKAHNYLGLALAQRGDYQRAREHFLLAGSEQMAEKMERAVQLRSSPSITIDLSPASERAPTATDRPLPPLASPLATEPPPTPPELPAVQERGETLEASPDAPSRLAHASSEAAALPAPSSTETPALLTHAPTEAPPAVLPPTSAETPADLASAPSEALAVLAPAPAEPPVDLSPTSVEPPVVLERAPAEAPAVPVPTSAEAPAPLVPSSTETPAALAPAPAEAPSGESAVPSEAPSTASPITSLASDWGDHVPETSAAMALPEFVIEEVPEVQGPEPFQFTGDEPAASRSMDDAHLIPVDDALEPVDVHMEHLPPDGAPIPSLGAEVGRRSSPLPTAPEGSMWMTEHLADIPLQPEPRPAASSDSGPVWSPAPWVDAAPPGPAEPHWEPPPEGVSWSNEAPTDLGALGTSEPAAGALAGASGSGTFEPEAGDTAPMGARWDSEATPVPSSAAPWSSRETPVVPPVGPPDGSTPRGDGASPEGPALTPEAIAEAVARDAPSHWTEPGLAPSETPTPPEGPSDDSHWVMKPVSAVLANTTRQRAPVTETWVPRAAPAPSPGFSAMPSQRLAELGDPSSWAHESTDDPFQLGPAGLAVTVGGEMLLRMAGLVAMMGSLQVRPEPRRRRGRPTAEPFGEGPWQLHRVSGHGVVYIEGTSGFHSLDLSDQGAASVDDDGAYLREELVFAFEESVAFDNGRLTDELGQCLELVHLAGHGRVLLRLDGGLKAMPVPPGTPTLVPVSRLVGWFGRVTPRLVALGGQGAVELTGDGFALLLTPG